MPTKRGVFLVGLALCAIVASCACEEQPEFMSHAQLSVTRVEKNTMSVSGISSGGPADYTVLAAVSYSLQDLANNPNTRLYGDLCSCMATQLHVAYSSSIMGVGIVSGAPYWCAQSDVMVALSSCMKYPDLISVPTLIGAVDYAYGMNSIDNPVYLQNSNVFIFHGTLDNELVLGVADKLIDFYMHYVPSARISSNLTIPAAHSFVTKNYGNPCSYFGEPYMNDCDYDTAGHVLKWIYGPLNPPTRANSSNIVSMDQSSFVPFPYTTTQISMAKLGYAYIPTACHDSRVVCRLHVALHGCLQNIDSIGFAFINYSGYNEWAESNNIVVIYPQTIASPTIPYNPKACWDWWGYTGPEYASQLAPQLQVIRGMMKTFTVV